MKKAMHYIILGTGKPNQIGLLQREGPIDDAEGNPVYVGAEDYAELFARAKDLSKALVLHYRSRDRHLAHEAGIYAYNAAVQLLKDMR